ncbi:AAA family ATPase [Bradyrhizobium sp. Arg62]|uniref:AAA family ATPase n=1 Tax=Bradyrhizobium brasilense TaxID=1419277 RepID=UPI001E4AA6A7|nr:AAA family ATPase [Bradyrhizobium brasilense]MCC8946480.1 AAA family ATPase [Bradyrhizobium brasilense]
MRDRRFQSRSLSRIKSQKVNWLLRPFIPSGFITTVAGDGEVGKTTMIYDILARITTGEPMPTFGGEPQAEPVKGSVVIFCKEDHPGLMIKPRMRAAGADTKKVHLIGIDHSNDKNEFDVITRLDTTLGEVERLIRDLGDVAAILIDPITDFAGELNLYREDQVREFLQPIAQLAARYGIAVINVLHLIKDTRKKPRQRILGSVGLVNVSRSVLLVGSGNGTGRRFLMMEKANLWHEKKAVAFAMSNHAGQPIVEWDTEWEDVDTEEVLAGKSVHVTKVQQAVFIIQNWLAEGARPAREVDHLAQKARFHLNTFKAAKKEIGVISEKRDDGWWWALPQEHKQDEADNEMPLKRERLH